MRTSRSSSLRWCRVGVTLAGFVAIGLPLCTADDADCPVCEGQKTISCPRCTEAPCGECADGTIACADCDGTGGAPCARCRGKPARSCPSCDGKGRIWREKKRVYGKTGGRGTGGLQRIIPAHWETCRSCRGRGEFPCRFCGGTGRDACKTCRGEGVLLCARCARHGPRDPAECAACEGLGRIECPRCLRRELSKEAPTAGTAGASTVDVDEDVLRDLRWARSRLVAEPPLRPLLALRHASRHDSPLVVVVLREALTGTHRWVRALALEELAKRDVDDLVRHGGVPLVRSLIRLGKEVGEPGAREAELLLRRLSRRSPQALEYDSLKRRWKFRATLFWAGSDLPSASREGPSTAKVSAERGRGRTRVGPETLPRTPEAIALDFGAEELEAKGIDLIWAIDHSGSMQHSFDAVRGDVLLTTKILSELLGSLHVGVVSYRDEATGRLRLTPDVARFQRALAALRADGGGSYPEGVDVAVREAVAARTMGHRRDALARVVVVGDRGPTPERSAALLQKLAELTRSRRTLRVHALKVARSLATTSDEAFLDDLAAAGGGAAVHLVRDKRPLENLMEAILDDSRIPEKPLERILRLALEVEGWQPRQPAPGGGIGFAR